MPPLYKEGLYWLILLAIVAAAYGVLAIFIGPIPAEGAFGLFGLAGLQPLLYRKRRKKVVWDERDTLINYRAVLAAYSVFWLVFSLGVTGLWAVLYYEGQPTISIHVLPGLVMGGFLLVATSRAVAIVLQYRLQGASEGE